MELNKINSLVELFFEICKKKTINDPFLEWLKPMKDSFSKIVEIGCGEGNTLNYLSKGLKSEAFGVEPSNEAVDVVKRKYKDIIILH